ncbi:MAG: SUMF1/EgtB/PvdO family nonheme iron enzyme [Kiritimatiellae bacterium]|nr:SUMF1/EgtB/PvdO family nonheme iron enzyme [Kiritimatiellia bacterium]
MKTKLIAAIVGLAAFASSASVTISDVIVRQQWPWNGKVNIDYVLSDPEEGEHDITVVMSNGLHVVTNEYGSLSGDIFGVKPGARRIVWDPSHNGATYSEKVMPNFSVTLSTPDDNSRKFMILDLSGAYAADAPIPVSFASAPPEGGWNTDEYKTTKMVLRRIPAGSFMMGSPTTEPDRDANLETLHRVNLTKDFYVALFLCSQKQYRQIYGRIPYETDGGGASHAGYSVASNDTKIVSFASYSELRGMVDTSASSFPHCVAPSFFKTLDARAHASLPSELSAYEFDMLSSSEWEYACRAGTSSAFYNGGDSNNVAGVIAFGANGWFGGIGKSGLFAPNNFGLYDMVGTVGHLVADRMPGSGAYWGEGELTDPLLWNPPAPKFIRRGGGWWWPLKAFRSAYCESAGGGISDANQFHSSVRVALVYRGE